MPTSFWDILPSAKDLKDGWNQLHFSDGWAGYTKQEGLNRVIGDTEAFTLQLEGRLLASNENSLIGENAGSTTTDTLREIIESNKSLVVAANAYNTALASVPKTSTANLVNLERKYTLANLQLIGLLSKNPSFLPEQHNFIKQTENGNTLQHTRQKYLNDHLYYLRSLAATTDLTTSGYDKNHLFEKHNRCIPSWLGFQSKASCSTLELDALVSTTLYFDIDAGTGGYFQSQGATDVKIKDLLLSYNDLVAAVQAVNEATRKSSTKNITNPYIQMKTYGAWHQAYTKNNDRHVHLRFSDPTQKRDLVAKLQEISDKNIASSKVNARLGTAQNRMGG